jgi:hypothetical protein
MFFFEFGTPLRSPGAHARCLWKFAPPVASVPDPSSPRFRFRSYSQQRNRSNNLGFFDAVRTLPYSTLCLQSIFLRDAKRLGTIRLGGRIQRKSSRIR